MPLQVKLTKKIQDLFVFSKMHISKKIVSMMQQFQGRFTLKGQKLTYYHDYLEVF